MNQDIHTHLEKLKTELTKLEPAVKHLQKADENATALVASLTNIHKDFAKHLLNIEKSLAEANEKHQKLLTKEIQDSTKKINEATELHSKSNSSFEKQIKGFLSAYESLASSTVKLIEKIDKVDFPVRLDKLDATVSSVNQGLQNTQTRIGDLERNVKDDVQARTQALDLKIENTDKSLTQRLNAMEVAISARLDSVKAENKVLRLLLFVTVTLNVVLGVLIFLKK